MTDTIELTAQTREAVGKANRQLKGTGQLAGVLYGPAVDPIPVSLDRHGFELLVSHEGGLASKVLKLSVDGGAPINVIVKALQRDPTRGTLLHVDLWAVNIKQAITAVVQIQFNGESPGVKTGGVLTHNMREVTVEALPMDLPDHLEVDISTLEIGDSVHVSDIPVPEGVTLHAAEDEIVASVLAPKVEEEEAAEGEEISEPEVIGEAASDDSEA